MQYVFVNDLNNKVLVDAMRNLILTLGILGVLISLFMILGRRKTEDYFEDDEEIHFELYAQ